MTFRPCYPSFRTKTGQLLREATILHYQGEDMSEHWAVEPKPKTEIANHRNENDYSRMWKVAPMIVHSSRNLEFLETWFAKTHDLQLGHMGFKPIRGNPHLQIL